MLAADDFGDEGGGDTHHGEEYAGLAHAQLLDSHCPQREGKAGAEDGEAEDRFKDFPGDKFRIEIFDAFCQEERQEVHGSDQELVHHDDLRLVAVGEKFCQGGVADL